MFADIPSGCFMHAHHAGIPLPIVIAYLIVIKDINEHLTIMFVHRIQAPPVLSMRYRPLAPLPAPDLREIDAESVDQAIAVLV